MSIKKILNLNVLEITLPTQIINNFVLYSMNISV